MTDLLDRSLGIVSETVPSLSNVFQDSALNPTIPNPGITGPDPVPGLNDPGLGEQGLHVEQAPDSLPLQPVHNALKLPGRL